jgi:hypothetical protein
VPFGDGFTKSANPTFAPNEAASFEVAYPPEPPPNVKLKILLKI